MKKIIFNRSRLPLPHWRDKALWETVCSYVLILLIFHFTQKNMLPRHYGIMARQALLPIFGFYFVQRITQKPLFSRTWLPSLIIGFAWFALIPILQHFSSATIHHWNPRFDIIFGIYLLLLLIVLQSALILLKRVVPPQFTNVVLYYIL